MRLGFLNFLFDKLLGRKEITLSKNFCNEFFFRDRKISRKKMKEISSKDHA